jgi:23S rRNA (adenine-N6)-dimethyltransferase
VSTAESNLNIRYSQNKIRKKELVQRLVRQSSIVKGDLVYDIGAGTGVITAALLKEGTRVIAIEKDRALYLKLKQKIIDPDRLELHCADFLDWKLPEGKKYKVFSNIPFFHTADIINKVLLGDSPPEDCYLIVQKEAAEKFAGVPRETLASLLLKPLFWVDIIYHFDRSDFRPVPAVDIALFQAEKRKCRLVSEQHYDLYRDFIIYCRESPHRTVKKALSGLFSYLQMKRLSRLLYIDYRSDPAELNFMQYLSIFQFYLENRQETIPLVRGAGERMKKLQVKRVKVHRASRIR